MSTRILSFWLAMLFSLSLFANGTDPEVTLCSGKKMSWNDYQMFKKLRSDDYDIEIDYMSNQSFVSYEASFVNNSVGAWSSIIEMPLVAAAAANLPDGRVMTWSAKDKLSFGGNLGRTWTTIFDPSNNSSTEFLVEETGHDMFCPGTSTLPDGRIIVSGGSSSNKSSIYDPFTGQWNTGDDLNITRGYHSSVTLASGGTFIIGGSWSGGVGNKHAEVWSEKTKWYRLNGVPVETITDGIDSPQNPQKDDYFPWLWVAPNGKLFHAGPSPSMHWIDPTGVGETSYAGERGNDQYSINGTSVMYDVGKILKTGGSGTFEDNSPAIAGTYVIDINTNNAQTTQVGNLNSARNFHSSVALPNGEVMVIGGIPISDAFSDNNSILTPEIWNPTTGQWTQMANMSVPRNYHSISLLMVDGRVYTAGGGLCGSCATNHPDAQIFSPPYLFNGSGTLATRPVINSAPTTANYNSNIAVNANSTINNFSLVRMSSTTHSTNNDQRRISLSKTDLGGNQYQVNIPNRNILPPGRYMLFAMNNAGTPSIAKIIKIGDDINDCTPLNNPNLGGIGLQATYFNNADLSAQVISQTDATVDFNWGTGSPASNIGVETFSARWEGDIEVPRSGTYSFYTNSDDGVRLWVNGKLMVNNWTDHAAIEDIGLIHLEPNQRYSILLEYYEQSGGAQIQLRWSGPGIEKQIIPSQNLFPPGFCSQLGDACNDNNACTTNDLYDADCNCSGTFQDTDNDGVCNANDQCPNLDNNLLGTACDDGNPNTSNDIYQSNCNCAGTPTGGGDCADVSIVAGSGSISVSGLNSPVTQVQIFDPTWATILNCAGNCNASEVVSGLANGTYFVKVTLYTANWGLICATEEYVTVGGGGGGCTDNDNDGICADQDCDDNNASLPASQGTACNDGNPNTDNDVIQSDGCSCAGTPTGGGNECDNLAISFSGSTLSIAGLNASPVAIVHVFNSQWQTIFNCSGDCDPTVTISNLASDTYLVKTTLYTAAWSQICIDETYITGGSNGVVVQQESEDFFFTAQKNGQEVSLYWVSNTAYKNRSFEIERSHDGINYEVIAEVESESDAINTHVNYSNADASPYKGSNFYRVKKLHFDGTFDYSATREVNFELDLNSFSIFPNPTSREVYVNLREYAGEQATVSIYNNYGKLMLVQSIDQIIEQPYRFMTEGLPGGLYLVAVKVGDRKLMTTKLIVNRL